MDFHSLIYQLQDKDDKKAYAKTKEVAAESEFSDKYYSCLDEFSSLLTHEKSYIRVRAFILCCSQSKWDKEGKIRQILPQMFRLFQDEKPTVVRQCLNAIIEVAVFRPELCEDIRRELFSMDLSRYKENMAVLIQKDMDELLQIIEEVINGA